MLEWESLRRRMDDERYEQVLAQLRYQAARADVWRDAVNAWFFKESNIPDGQGRVGHPPGRTEAEAMTLDGYRIVDVVPWEAASGGKAVSCPAPACSASFAYQGVAGWFTLRVEYFDQNNGVSRFRLFIGDQVVDRWAASDRLPTAKIDGSSSTRREISGIALRPGDHVRVEGVPGGGEPAPLDYVEINPDRTGENPLNAPRRFAPLPRRSPRPSPSR